MSMNTQDFYSTLGVDREADDATIRRAYRRLASKHHPDRGGNKEDFQRIQEAYETLGDPQRRATYDRPQPQGHFHFQGGVDLNSIFGSMFGGSPFPSGGFKPQTRMTLWVTLSDIATGGRRPVSVGTQSGVSMIEIDIPVGIEDGSTVQYSGIAPGGGDLLVTFKTHPHPVWSRDGQNLFTEHTVSVWDCILGGETEIRDVVNNRITLTVPALTQPGTVLRLRGRGLKIRNTPDNGDLLVKIQARIPDNIPHSLLQEITTHRGTQQ